MTAADYAGSVLSPAAVRLSHGLAAMQGQQLAVGKVAQAAGEATVAMARLLQRECPAGRLLLVQYDDRPDAPPSSKTARVEEGFTLSVLSSDQVIR